MKPPNIRGYSQPSQSEIYLPRNFKNLLLKGPSIPLGFPRALFFYRKPTHGYLGKKFILVPGIPFFLGSRIKNPGQFLVPEIFLTLFCLKGNPRVIGKSQFQTPFPICVSQIKLTRLKFKTQIKLIGKSIIRALINPQNFLSLVK